MLINQQSLEHIKNQNNSLIYKILLNLTQKHIIMYIVYSIIVYYVILYIGIQKIFVINNKKILGTILMNIHQLKINLKKT